MPNLSNLTNLSFNFTYWQQHLVEFFIMGYVRALGFFFWPMVFTGIIAYVYIKNQSAVAAAVAILITFASFVTSGIFLQIPALVLLLQGVVCLAVAGLVTYFFTHRRQ